MHGRLVSDPHPTNNMDVHSGSHAHMKALSNPIHNSSHAHANKNTHLHRDPNVSKK